MPWDFAIYLLAILNLIIQSTWIQSKLGKQLSYFSDNTVPADALAPDGARASAGTVVTKYGPCMSIGTSLEGFVWYFVIITWQVKFSLIEWNYLWASAYKSGLYMKCFSLGEWVILSMLYICHMYKCLHKCPPTHRPTQIIRKLVFIGHTFSVFWYNDTMWLYK